jgi:hypothetical protein
MLKVEERLSHGGGPPQLQTVVTGITPGQRIEFSFVYGDPDLSVELVLPLEAFREFCSENNCRITVADAGMRASLKRLFGPVAITPFLSPV